jgi:hypothetical protein
VIATSADPKTAKQIGLTIRVRVLEQFSDVANRILDLFRWLLGAITVLVTADSESKI